MQEFEVFKTENSMVIDGKEYLIHRHFASKRSLQDAVYSAVKNEAVSLFSFYKNR